MTPEERKEIIRRVMCCGTLCWAHRDPAHCKAQQNIPDDEVNAIILAALQSLLEPTEAMVDAAWDGTLSAHEPHVAHRTWKAMLQQAIKEHSE